MGRGYYITGQALITTSLGELGLADDPIVVTPNYKHLDIHVDAFGDSVPNQQFMGADCRITMTLVHVDPAVLKACLAASTGAGTEGTLPNAGTLMGQDKNGAGTTSYFSLTISSPVATDPWVFPSVYMPDAPVTWPLGAERSVIQCTFRCVPYAADPVSSAGVVLWHH